MTETRAILLPVEDTEVLLWRASIRLLLKGLLLRFKSVETTAMGNGKFDAEHERAV